MSTRRRAFTALAASTLLALAACTGGAGDNPADPFEDYNRWVHRNNLRVDRAVLRPAARAYDAVTPTLAQHLVGNAFSHAGTVTDLANHVLQGRPRPALRSLGRLTLNTVLGAGGLLDPATEFGLPREDTDFGVTLARYGMDEGPYWVLWLVGPATTRDMIGQTVDLALNPFLWFGVATDRLWLPPASTLGETVDFRAGNMPLIDDLLYESDDSYTTLRTIYLQHRRARIAGGETVVEDLPDIFGEGE
ncbi:MAG TPA: VacJ family lipoprotein [Thermohalobaculum sp.]|nr:VacJ family lipoprotein [Thermohalobaculum sp.]